MGAAMLSEISKEDFAAALDSAASDLLDQAGVHQPPVDAVALAWRLGLTVAWDDRQAGRARLVQLAGEAGEGAASILLKPEPRLERQHWAVAHEIGEVMAERVFAQLGVNPVEAPRQAREQVANGLASRLLLPKESFGVDGAACGWDLLALKDQYATASHELIARRMLDFVTPVIVAVYDQNRLTWRKSNMAGRLTKPSPRELQLRDQAHASGEAVSDDGPPPIRVWAVHEPMWQREIVRVEVDEFAQ